MAEWETSYGGMLLHNARLLTDEEIKERYPAEMHSRMALLTLGCKKRGYDILYGENPNLTPMNCIEYDWRVDVVRTAAYLYGSHPNRIVLRCYTDMSESKAIYAAVRLRNLSDVQTI